MAALGDVGDVIALEATLLAYPELLTEGARAKLAAVVEQALAVNDELAVRVATAELELLEECAHGDVANGWAKYEAVVHDFYTSVLDPQVTGLQEAFDDVFERQGRGQRSASS